MAADILSRFPFRHSDGSLMLRWQSRAWISNLHCEHAFEDGKFYVDQPLFSRVEATRRILILTAGAGLLAWLFKGQLGLGFWQIFVIIVGFPLLYRDSQFFGAPMTSIGRLSSAIGKHRRAY